MWQPLEQKIVQVNKATGLEVIFLPDGRYTINCITISSKKNRIIREQEATGITQISELAKKTDKKIPLSVVFNGKGILVKKIAGAQAIENAVIAILPNANPADFYFSAHTHGDFSVVAIARKEIIESFIQALQKEGFTILQASLGFEMVMQVLPFIYLDDQSTIFTSLFSLQINAEKKITGFDSLDARDNEPFRTAEYSIGDQYIRPAYVLAFAAAVQMLTGSLHHAPALQSASLINERSEFRDQKLYRFAGLALLTAIFLILLVNFLIYNYYFNRNKELQVSQVFSREKKEQAAVIQERLRKKEDFLNRSGWFKPCRASLYADRIASLTPFNTLLTSMTIYPLKGNASGDFPVLHFKTDTIQVTGTCENPVEINQFMNNLKIIPEFKTVALKNYLYKKEKETATFSLEIITR
ncbi:hypothetical protein [Longitalea arenae]|uniref:hypothetical protein n=1 Tax=Longitalea arenae TaxID=2812558 RepID=UPI0019673022|nr:hypothetical protein [Longitalea arenae]